MFMRLSPVIKIICWFLLALSAFFLTAALLNQSQLHPSSFPLSGREWKQYGKQVGSFAEYGVFGAIGFWVVKQIFIRWKIDTWKSFWQKMMLLLKQNHTLIGWVTLGIATSHACYFLINQGKNPVFLYTGIAAYAGLLLVTLFGAVFQRAASSRKGTPSHRKRHMVLALVFIVLFLCHLYIE